MHLATSTLLYNIQEQISQSAPCRSNRIFLLSGRILTSSSSSSSSCCLIVIQSECLLACNWRNIISKHDSYSKERRSGRCHNFVGHLPANCTRGIIFIIIKFRMNPFQDESHCQSQSHFLPGNSESKTGNQLYDNPFPSCQMLLLGSSFNREISSVPLPSP